MSGGGPQMRAQGLRGTAALVGFVALIVIAAMFGGCGLIGSPAESSNAARDTPDTASPATTFSEPATLPPAQPLPRGTATPTLPLPRPADVPQGDAAKVSSAALTVMYTYDTTTDTTTQDAVLRAEPWMTPEYAATQREHLSVAAPGLEWATWREHRAYTAPTLEPVTEEAPSDTATAAYRQWLVTYKPVGRDGWQGAPVTVVAYVTLERATASDPWRLSDVRVNSS
ncbi:hypothetical protein LO772_26365 [Yinghuangia sp. ASG 101]|uniref:hypothetical protein n=1 Tax=Yinghuangia sp. ASG 101 TaxID=2896848 RepID=UPI001E32B74C|nr:hypothetical protein [Yinghuangia sp. ASG 101]UGQ10360.1 hypothetical protein LO772_26365 [Yinghuangia sp. ASG 101]